MPPPHTVTKMQRLTDPYNTYDGTKMISSKLWKLGNKRMSTRHQSVREKRRDWQTERETDGQTDWRNCYSNTACSIHECND